MAQVYGQIDLVGLGDIELTLFILKEYGHKLVANFGCVLRVIRQAETFSFHVDLKFEVVFQF